MKFKKSKLNKRKRSKVRNINITGRLNLKVFSWIVVFVLLVSNVFYVIQTSTGGANYANLEYIIESENKKKNELEEKLVNTSSLIKLNERSEELGFYKTENTLYIDADEVYATKLK